MISKLNLQRLLSNQEGLRLKPYRDSLGYLSIGVGRCLDTVGISADEAMYLLDSDIDRAIGSAKMFSWFDDLTDNRQNAIVCMIFNLGLGGFSEFKNLITALTNKDYASASNEMLNSHWAQQVGQRAQTLAKMVIDG